MPTPINNLEEINHAEPDLKTLLAELQLSLSDSGAYQQQLARDYNTRYCLWDGQSHDGRKHARQTGKEPFPFEGASDSRVRTADEFINLDVKMMKAAFRRSTIQCSALNSDNIASGQKATYLLQWLFKDQLKQEIGCEIELVANWRQMHGLAVMGIFWEQERRLEYLKIDPNILRDIAMKDAQQGDHSNLQMFQKILDPLQETEMIRFLRNLAPLLDNQGARKVLRDLRNMQTPEIPQAYVIKSLPRWQALRPFIDVFWAIRQKSLQRSRWISHCEWLTETDLKDRVVTDGWDQAFVDQALEQKGKAFIGTADGFLTDWTMRRNQNLIGGQVDDHRNLIQIFHHYYRGIDQRTGVPATYCTVVHPAIKEAYAKHDLSAYQHGKFPYVEFVRERIDHAMAESRGMADIIAPGQNEIKAQIDARTDVTSITTMPPALVPMNRVKTKLSFGPGTQHGVRKPGEISWMQPPMNDGRSIEIERSTRAGLDRYHGRYSEEVSPIISQLFSQDTTESFLDEAAEAGMMTLQLAQQYMTDVQVMKIAGNLSQPFHVSREEIQGKFTLQLTFDSSLLDMEYVEKKINAFETLLGLDQGGVIDRAGFIQVAASWLDPNLADRLVRSPGAAADAEVADEKNNLSNLINGIEPPMATGGQNFALRLQTLEDTLRQNPLMPQIIEARPDRKAMLEARVKHLQFMVQQQNNAQTGRTGSEPGLQQLQQQQTAPNQPQQQP